jgi:hypothetical protein
MSWIEKIEEEQKQRLEAKGIKPIYNIQEGENKLIIKLSEPRRINTRFGERLVFDIVDDKGEERALMVSTNSSLIRALLPILKRAIDNGKKEVAISIIRVGKGISTRYSVKQL